MVSVFYGIFYDEGTHRIPPTHINYLCAIVCGVNNSRGEIVVLKISPTSIFETGSKGHQTAMWRDPGDAKPVVRLRSDDTRDVCPVSCFIVRVVIADCPIATAGKGRGIAEIPTVFVVNVAVAVIVNAVSRNLTDVFPKLRTKFRVLGRNPAINDRYCYLRFSSFYIPCVRYI